jgi:virginiamycin A acetyltransferase
MPAAQEPGFIEIGRYCTLGDDIKMYVYGDHDYKNVTTSPLVGLVDYKEYYPAIPTDHQGGQRLLDRQWCPHRELCHCRGWGRHRIDGCRREGCASVSIVVGNPARLIVVGNPARLIKYRFAEEQIRSLLEIQ